MAGFGGDRNNLAQEKQDDKNVDEILTRPIEWIKVDVTFPLQKDNTVYKMCIFYDPPDIVAKGIFARDVYGRFISLSKTLCDSAIISITLSGIPMGDSFENSCIPAEAWFNKICEEENKK